MTQHLILDSQLHNWSFYDVDTAANAIQKMLGVENGDVAAVVFSGFDWDDASIEARQAKLREYVKIECAYLSA